jgi:molybdopterin synthase catalytic subunit
MTAVARPYVAEGLARGERVAYVADRDPSELRQDLDGLPGLDEHVVPRLERIATELRRRWPEAGRVVLWHRVGELGLGESSVVVAVSSPHRAEAFEAARFGIDALKASAPIWKKEFATSGSYWVEENP